MKPRHLLMGAALVVAAGLVLFGDRTPASQVAEAVVRPHAPARARVEVASAPSQQPQILRLVPRSELIGEGEDHGANAVFQSQNWNPPPPKPVAPPPPPPPTAPPLPFVFIGKASTDGHMEVYLARGDKVYVVKNKDVIDGQYRVDTIAPPMMTLTYLPMNQVQQMIIGALE